MSHPARVVAPAQPAVDPDFPTFPLPVLQRGQLYFRTLGAAEIHVGPDLIVGPASERMFALLVVIAMAPEHRVARSRLMELVWSDMDDESARHSLRQHSYRLRQGGLLLHGTRDGLAMDRDALIPSFALDRTEALFERDVLLGHEPFGHLFAGWVPTHSAMQSWVEHHRERYHADVRRILIPELRRLRDRAQWTECERWARTVLEFDAYNEDATLILAQALVMTGSRVTATALLEGFVRETGAAGTELGRRVEREHARIMRSGRVLHEHSATRTLVGRDEVLASLDAVTMRAVQGEAQVMYVCGPAGIGKTEIAYEATRRAVLLGFSRCVVRASRPVGQVTHGTLSRVTRDLLQLPGALGCSPGNLRLLRQFAGVESAASFTDFVDTEPAAPLVECLLELVTSIAEERPLLVFVDDLQYVDPQSAALLEQLCDLLQRGRVLVLLTSRVTGQAPRAMNSEAQTFHSILLGPLSVKSCALIASEVQTATGQQLNEEQSASVARASDRTPLHVIALAREQLVSGFRSTMHAEVHVALTRQIKRLSIPATIALRCISIVGGSIRGIDLDRILQIGFVDRVQTLRELVDSGLVEEGNDGSVQAHDEVVAAAFTKLGSSERSIIQRQVATVLDSVVEAGFSAEIAITALRVARESGDIELFIRLCLKHVMAIADAGLVSGALELLTTAVELAQTNADRASLTSLLATSANRASSWQVSLESAARLRRLGTTSTVRDSELLLTELEATLNAMPRWSVRRDAATVLEMAGDSALSDELRVRALTLAIGASSNLLMESLAHDAYAILSAMRTSVISPSDPAIEPYMQYHAVFGSLDEATKIAWHCQMPALGEPRSAFWVRLFCNACFVLRFGGETGAARERLREAFDSHALRDNPGRRAYAAWQLSLIAAETGNIDDAEEWANALDGLLRTMPGRTEEMWAVMHRHRMELLRSGDIQDSSTLVRLVESEKAHRSRAVLYASGLALSSSDTRRDMKKYLELLSQGQTFLKANARFGGQDVLASGVLFALESLGRTDEAKSVARKFIADRRERFSPAPIFVQSSEDLQQIIATAHERKHGRAENPSTSA